MNDVTSYMPGPFPAPTRASRRVFITWPMPYPFSSIQAWTMRSVFSSEKSSMPASTPRSSASMAGFCPFQYLRTCFSSYSAGASKKNDVRSHRSVVNVARSFMMPAARPATSSGTSMPWLRRIGW